MDGTLFLFEDHQVDRMRPVSLTRHERTLSDEPPVF